MDLTINLEDSVLNLRSSAIILKDDKILLSKDHTYNIVFLPGGRIRAKEDSLTAIKRELMEELNYEANINKLLFINENFFEFNNKAWQEICFFYLINITKTDLVFENDILEIIENDRLYSYYWVPLTELHKEPLNPQFLKEKLLNLPEFTEHIIYKENK